MSEQEIWKNVVGYENIYQVSNLGRVKRIARGSGATPGKILKPHRNRTGYLIVILSYNGQKRTFQTHRLVALAFLRCPSLEHQVNHKNGIRTDNQIANLEWVTRSENAKHAYRVLGVKPRRPRGEKCGMSKLTGESVRKIRELYSTGNYTQKEIGRMFNIVQSTISSIVRGETWSHIPCQSIPAIKKTHRGEDKYSSKLTSGQVESIRQMYATGRYTHRGLGQRFGVSRTTIASVVSRKTWSHIGY